MNQYFLEDYVVRAAGDDGAEITTDRYVVYVIESGQESRLLRSFPNARRTTRAKAVQLCRTHGRAGDWCQDGQSEMQAARELGGDMDIDEAKKATARAIEVHEDYLKELEQFKPLLDYRRPRSLAQSPPR